MSLSSQNKEKKEKRRKKKEDKIKMCYFKPRNMHLFEHGSNQFFFKPRMQERYICGDICNIAWFEETTSLVSISSLQGSS